MSLEIKTNTGNKKTNPEAKTKHDKAVVLVEKNKEMFQIYAGKHGVEVEPAPEGLDTFAYDLEKGKIYVNDIFWKENAKEEDKLLANEKSAFAVRHEIEHMLEHRNMLQESEDDNLQKVKGKYIWEQYLDKLGKDEAYGLMDNCVSDIRQNRAVVSKTNQEERGVEKKMYEENLFVNNDLRFQTDQFGGKHETPKHIQLAEALLVEARSRECVVDEEVRKVINKIKGIKNPNTGKDLIETITNPNVPMSDRLFFQDSLIWPEIEKLRKKDLEDEKNKENKNKNSKGEGEGKGENKKGEQESENKSENNKKENPQNQNNKQESKEEGENKNPEPTAEDYNKAFKESYERAKKQMLPKADNKEVKKAGEEYLKKNPDLGENKQEKVKREKGEMEEKKANDLGVDVEDLRKYEDLSNSLRSDESYRAVSDLIKKIVSERKREKFRPKYPTEEGDEMLDPAQLISDVKSGNLKPKVWADTEIKEYKGELFSEIEMSLVVDRSGSMEENGKIKEAQKAVVLFMNSQKELQEEVEDGEEDNGLIKGLKVSWEVYSFQNTSQDFTPIKSMSDEFSDKDRINVCAHFNDATGSRTTDANCLESIFNDLDSNNEKKEKLEEKELKKIVIVLTDGESHQTSKISDYLKKFKDLGVVVVGIGITEEGRSVLTTYSGDSRVAKKAEDISKELGDIIENQFKDLLPLRD
ncbi:MAG: hypothetical protein QG630_452 [Patescibacteria group bacterium]|nr:hypothetical protein [Patescibacteria group bacterium]